MRMNVLLKAFFITILATGFATASIQASGKDNQANPVLDDKVFKIAEGRKVVNQNEKAINQHSKLYGIPSDWLKAIIIVGAIRSNSLPASRVPPTYIDAIKFNGLDGVKMEQFNDVDTNLRLCALLLKRILDRLLPENQKLKFVASLYDDISSSQVSDYGLQVERVYTQKLWEEK